MNYFRTAEEAADRLGLGLLHRADADSRSLVRRDRLAAYATDPVQSAQAWTRIEEELRSQGAAPRSIWMTGPYGGMGQLPWAVGFAERLARGGDQVLLAGPEIPSLLPAHPGARSREIPQSVVDRLSGLIPAGNVAVSTDLEGVRIVAPHRPPMPKPGAPQSDATTFLLWVQSLPEELGTRLPWPDAFDGVVLVASFRDHTPFELEACTRQLRTAGHPLVGLLAIGPDESQTMIPEPLVRPDSVRPSSIWDDSLPRPERPAPRRSGKGSSNRSEAADRSPRVERSGSGNRTSEPGTSFPIPGRDVPSTRASSSPPSGLVTETSWAHLASGDRANIPVAPDRESRELLDRLSPRERGPGPKTRVPDSRSDDRPGGRESVSRPQLTSLSAPVKITLVEAESTPQPSPPREREEARPLQPPAQSPAQSPAQPPVQPPAQPTGPSKEESDSVWSRLGDATDSAATTVSASRTPQSASSLPEQPPTAPESTVMAEPANPANPANPVNPANPNPVNPANPANPTNPVDSAKPESTDDSQPMEETPSVPATPETRTVPLIGLWEREHHRESMAKRVLRITLITLASVLSVGAVYWFGTGHSVEELRELVLGGKDPAVGAAAPTMPPDAGVGTSEDVGPGNGGSGGVEAGAALSGGQGATGDETANDDGTSGESAVDDESIDGVVGDDAAPGENANDDESIEGAEGDDGASGENAVDDESIDGVEGDDGASGENAVDDESIHGATGDDAAPGESPTDDESIDGAEDPVPDRPSGLPGTTGAPESGGVTRNVKDPVPSVPAVEAVESGKPSRSSPHRDLAELIPADREDGTRSVLEHPLDAVGRLSDESPALDSSGVVDAAGVSATEDSADPVDADSAAESGWVVHLASFKRSAEASVGIARFQERGVEARALYVEVPERGPWYRVVAGRFTSFVEARRRALQLSEQLGLDAVHVIGRGGLEAPIPIPLPERAEESDGSSETSPEGSSGEESSSQSDQASDAKMNG